MPSVFPALRLKKTSSLGISSVPNVRTHTYSQTQNARCDSAFILDSGRIRVRILPPHLSITSRPSHWPFLTPFNKGTTCFLLELFLETFLSDLQVGVFFFFKAKSLRFKFRCVAYFPDTTPPLPALSCPERRGKKLTGKKLSCTCV